MVAIDIRKAVNSFENNVTDGQTVWLKLEVTQLRKCKKIELTKHGWNVTLRRYTTKQCLNNFL